MISGGGPYAAIAEAWAAGFLKDIPTAVDVLKRAQLRYPDDPTLPAVHAQVALLMDYRKQAKEAIERSLAIDPDDPTALEARANYKAGFESDLEGALADLERAVAIAPGSTTIWNSLGLVQSARGAEREAEAAFKRSIELDPVDPVSYANLAIFYLDQDRVAEAKVLIDKALAVDPSFSFALRRARSVLHADRRDGQRRAGPARRLRRQSRLFAGSAAARRRLLRERRAGAGGAVNRECRPARPQRSRHDQLRDGYRDRRLRLRPRHRERAGDVEARRRHAAATTPRSAPTARKDRWSTMPSACKGWMRGADTTATSSSTRSRRPAMSTSRSPAASTPFVVDLLPNGGVLTDPQSNSSTFSSLFQGLMLDPLMLSGRSRTANLFRRPFVEGSFGGGFTNNGSNDWEPTWSGELQGYQATPIPWSFYANVTAEKLEDFRSQTTPGVPSPDGTVRSAVREPRPASATSPPSRRRMIGLSSSPTPQETSPTFWAALVLAVPPVPGIPFGPPGSRRHSSGQPTIGP